MRDARALGDLLRNKLQTRIYYRVNCPTRPRTSLQSMSRSTRTLIRSLDRIPGLYPLLAFLTARRVAVRGWSMQPTLSPGERVLFDCLAYRAGDPRPGDIVLAVHPARPRIRMIKRVAGVPGDSVPQGPGGPLTGTSRGRDDPPGRLYAPEPAGLGGDEDWLLGGAD